MIYNWRLYRESGFKNPPGFKANSLLEPGSDDPRCWWAPVNAIIENDFNLAAGSYKPQIAEKLSDEDPTELIRETIALEREITEGLEKLLLEMESVE